MFDLQMPEITDLYHLLIEALSKPPWILGAREEKAGVTDVKELKTVLARAARRFSRGPATP